MNIYIYSDESGVFDKAHNDIFVFGGLIIPGTAEKELWSRKYAAAERTVRFSKGVSKSFELKATHIDNKEKNKMFRSLNNCFKFGVVVDQKRVLNQIFLTKKDKQRYLDYAYKIAVKRAFEYLINSGIITPSDVERLYFYVDEHTTATNGCYELQEGLEQEFKFGTYNYKYSVHFPPIFPSIEQVKLEYCNSQSKLLVRAADIVANKIYYYANRQDFVKLNSINNSNIIFLP